MESLIRKFKLSLPENDWGTVIKALRHDPIVWNAFFSLSLQELAFSHSNDQVSHWTTATLSFLESDKQDLIPKFLADKKITDKKFINSAEAALNLYLNNTDEDALTLNTAGLIAVALWQLGEETDVVNLIQEHENKRWETIFSCLLGLVSNKEGLIQALLSPSLNRSNHRIAIHMILSNPFTISEQANFLKIPFSKFT